MRDRIPTKVLENGAIRYARYDEQGNFLGYEYLLLADDPTDVGTPLNKPTFLTDETAADIWPVAGTRPADPTVNQALAMLRANTKILPATAAALGLSNTANATVDQAVAQLNTIKPKIQTGSYVGTGLYGEGNPNSLTFNFTPKILFIGGGSEDTYVGAFPFIYGASEVVSVHNVLTSKMTGLRVIWSENSVSWFVVRADLNQAWLQLNGYNANYFWVAIG